MKSTLRRIWRKGADFALLVVAIAAILYAVDADVTAHQTDLRIQRALSGQIAINKERIDAAGHTIADLEAQANRDTGRINVLEAEVAALQAEDERLEAALGLPVESPAAGQTGSPGHSGASPTPQPTAAPTSSGRPSSPPSPAPTPTPLVCLMGICL
jgi:hypothetical protein